MLRRSAIGALALTALAATSVLPEARAATPGAGTSSGGTELLHLSIGDGVVDLRLLSESSSTTTEATPRSALERIAPLTVSSTLLPALGALTLPAYEVSSTGSEQSTSTPGVDLGALAAASPVPGALGGTIVPTTLRAVADAAGSLALATGGATDLAVLGGVLRVGQIDAQVGSGAGSEAAGAFRGLTVDRVDVLDLGAVLQLLGLTPADLPLDVAAQLLAQLGLPLPGGAASPEALVATVEGLLDQAGTIPEQVAALDDQADALVAEAAGVQAELDQLAPLASSCNPLDPVLVALGISCSSVPATISTLQSELAAIDAQIDALLAQIDALLDQVLALLDPVFAIIDGLLAGILAAPLVVIEDLRVGVGAEAFETVAASTAEVAASIGAVRVGAVPVAGIDAFTTLDQLSGLADQLSAAVGGVLAIVDPSLANLVDIDLFERSTSVRSENGRSIAEAVLTGLRVRVTPPDLCALLGRLGTADTIGDLLDDLGQAVPATPLPVAAVLDDLGSIVTCTPTTGATVGAQLVGGLAPALTQPLTVEVLNVSGKGNFAAVPTQVPGPTTPGGALNPGLPRTGGEPLLLLFGTLAAVTAVGVRRAVVRANW